MIFAYSQETIGKRHKSSCIHLKSAESRIQIIYKKRSAATFVPKVPKTTVVGILCNVRLSLLTPQALVINDPAPLGSVYHWDQRRSHIIALETGALASVSSLFHFMVLKLKVLKVWTYFRKYGLNNIRVIFSTKTLQKCIVTMIFMKMTESKMHFQAVFIRQWIATAFTFQLPVQWGKWSPIEGWARLRCRGLSFCSWAVTLSLEL